MAWAPRYLRGLTRIIRSGGAGGTGAEEASAARSVASKRAEREPQGIHICWGAPRSRSVGYDSPPPQVQKAPSRSDRGGGSERAASRELWGRGAPLETVVSGHPGEG